MKFFVSFCYYFRIVPTVYFFRKVIQNLSSQGVSPSRISGSHFSWQLRECGNLLTVLGAGRQSTMASFHNFLPWAELIRGDCFAVLARKNNYQMIPRCLLHTTSKNNRSPDEYSLTMLITFSSLIQRHSVDKFLLKISTLSKM